MKYHPLLFKPEMVKANMLETKTLTTRILSKHNSRCGSLLTGDGQRWHSFDFSDVVFDGKKETIFSPLPLTGDKDYFTYIKVAVPQDGTRHRIFCKWQEGDIIWARESGWVHNNYIRGLNDPYLYWKADYELYDEVDRATIKNNCCQFPGIHMYKEFARLFLKITEVKVERLQDITQEDAKCEGLEVVEHSGLLFYKNYSDAPKNASRETLAFADPFDSFKSLWLKINGQKSWDENPIVWRIRYRKIPKPIGWPLGFLEMPKKYSAKK